MVYGQALSFVPALQGLHQIGTQRRSLAMTESTDLERCLAIIYTYLTFETPPPQQSSIYEEASFWRIPSQDSSYPKNTSVSTFPMSSIDIMWTRQRQLRWHLGCYYYGDVETICPYANDASTKRVCKVFQPLEE